MSEKLPTMKIIDKVSKIEATINVKDFDDAIHEKFVEKKAKAAPIDAKAEFEAVINKG
jgi:hypothetical protein